MRSRIISVSRRVDVFQIRRNRPCRAAATTRADALLGLKPAATNTLVSITIPSMGIPTAGFVIWGSEIAAIWIDRTLDVPRKCGGLDFVAVEIMNEGGEIARLRGLINARRAGALTSEFQRSRVEFDHCRLAARRGGRGDCQSLCGTSRAAHSTRTPDRTCRNPPCKCVPPAARSEAVLGCAPKRATLAARSFTAIET